MQDLRHTCFEDILGLFRLLEGKGNNVATLSGRVDGIFMKVQAIDEGRSAELDFVFVKEVLQIDFTNSFAVLDIPVNDFGVVSCSEAHVLLFSLDELNCIYDVEVPLIQQLHALEVIIVQSGVSFVIACSHDTLGGLYLDD